MRSELETYASGLSCDEDCGDVQGPGWYGLVNGPFTRDNAEDVKEWDALSDETRAELEGAAGIIIGEDSQGFIDVRIVDDPAELVPEWDRIMSEVSEWEAQADQD